jgi:hypothetical protein
MSLRYWAVASSPRPNLPLEKFSLGSSRDSRCKQERRTSKCQQRSLNSGSLWQLPVRWRHWSNPVNNPANFFAAGDWGDLSEEDRKENEFFLVHRFRLLSSYRLRNGVKVWVITEADRSSTTLLLPDEY